MAELYVTEFPAAPDKERRFGTFGNPYSGFQSIHFVPLNKVIFRDGNGNLTCAKPLSSCRRMVDDCRKAVADGWSQKWLASARVLKYLSDTNSFEVVYSGPEGVKLAEDLTDIPKIAQAADGKWRVVPTTGFTRGQREWNFKYAFMDSRGEPRPIHLTYPTLRGLIQLMFDSTFPIHQEMVAQFPLAAPADIPQPPEPVVEHVPTAAELAAVEPMTHAEYDKMPARIAGERYILDRTFAVACDKMWALDVKVQEAFRKKEEEESRTAAADKLRKRLAGDAVHGW